MVQNGHAWSFYRKLVKTYSEISQKMVDDINNSEQGIFIYADNKNYRFDFI